MSDTLPKQRLGGVFNVAIPLLLTVLGVWLVLELGLRHFYQLIPLEVCAADSILGNYYCQPYFEYDKPVRIAYHYLPNLTLEGYWDPANPYLHKEIAQELPFPLYHLRYSHVELSSTNKGKTVHSFYLL